MSNRSMVKLIHADNFYPEETTVNLLNAVHNLQFVEKDYGFEIDNFNIIHPGLDHTLSHVLGENVCIDEDRSGVFRKPINAIHFESFESLDEWCFIIALERTTFNLYHHVSGAKSALDGWQFNYKNLHEWDYNTNVLLEPNQGVFFRPWMFHSLENGIIQYYHLKEDKAFSNTKSILVMGLSGSGKSTLAKSLAEKLNAVNINADAIRKQYNDWDFTTAGRLRQADRMRKLAILSQTDYTVVDFICPTQQTRDYFNADFIIWLDTVNESKYPDTDKLFEPPVKYGIRLTDHKYNIDDIVLQITKK